MKIIAITSGKEGDGKSTLALNVAIALSWRGHRVLLVDAASGEAPFRLLSDTPAPCDLGEVMRGERTMEEALIDGPEKVTLLSLGSAYQTLLRMRDQSSPLPGHMFALLDPFDVVLIDTPMVKTRATLSLISAVDEAVTVLVPDLASVSRGYALQRELRSAGYRGKHSILFNQYVSGEQAQKVRDKMEAASRKDHIGPLNFLPETLRDPIFAEAERTGRPLMVAEALSEAALSIALVAERLAPSFGAEEEQGRMARFFATALRIERADEASDVDPEPTVELPREEADRTSGTTDPVTHDDDAPSVSEIEPERRETVDELRDIPEPVERGEERASVGFEEVSVETPETPFDGGDPASNAGGDLSFDVELPEPVNYGAPAAGRESAPAHELVIGEEEFALAMPEASAEAPTEDDPSSAPEPESVMMEEPELSAEAPETTQEFVIDEEEFGVSMPEPSSEETPAPEPEPEPVMMEPESVTMEEPELSAEAPETTQDFVIGEEEFGVSMPEPSLVETPAPEPEPEPVMMEPELSAEAPETTQEFVIGEEEFAISMPEPSSEETPTLEPEPESVTMEEPESVVMEEPESVVMEEPESVVMEEPESVVMEEPESVVMEEPELSAEAPETTQEFVIGEEEFGVSMAEPSSEETPAPEPEPEPESVTMEEPELSAEAPETTQEIVIGEEEFGVSMPEPSSEETPAPEPEPQPEPVVMEEPELSAEVREAPTKRPVAEGSTPVSFRIPRGDALAESGGGSFVDPPTDAPVVAKSAPVAETAERQEEPNTPEKKGAPVTAKKERLAPHPPKTHDTEELLEALVLEKDRRNDSLLKALLATQERMAAVLEWTAGARENRELSALENLAKAQTTLAESVERNTQTMAQLLERLDRGESAPPRALRGAQEAAPPPAVPSAPSPESGPETSANPPAGRMRRKSDIRDFYKFDDEHVSLLEINEEGNVNLLRAAEHRAERRGGESGKSPATERRGPWVER